MPILLVDVGRESADPAAIRGDAPADLRAAGARRLTGESCRRPSERREAKQVRCPQPCRGRRPPQFGSRSSHRDARPTWQSILIRARPAGVGCDRSRATKSEMSCDDPSCVGSGQCGGGEDSRSSVRATDGSPLFSVENSMSRNIFIASRQSRG